MSARLVVCFLIVMVFPADISIADEGFIPEQHFGPLDTEQAALAALAYFAGRVSTLGPCGDYAINAQRKGNEWLILETAVGWRSKRVSWRLWQLDARNAELLKMTDHEWSIETADCEGPVKSHYRRAAAPDGVQKFV